MPLYQMTGKDGKVYRIEGPAGLPRETVMAEILKRAPQAGKPALATPDAALAAPTAVAPAQVAPEGEGGAQRGLFEQIGSSLKSGLIGLASIPQQAATQAFAGPVNAADQEREIFDAIDSGKYKPKFKSEEELKEALSIAQADFVYELPEGLDTKIGEEGLSLSGGQRQRLALARAVAAKPAVLVLDDPLSALDVDTEALVEAALRKVLKKTTALIVAHRPSTVQLADRVALMQEGKIVAVGKHSDLLAINDHYRYVISSLDAAGKQIEVS